MPGRLEDKVAVITGAGSGIGRATALAFLAEGAKVVAADLNERTGAETVELADAAGHVGRVAFERTDVSVEVDVANLMDVAVREFGRLDIVFNNAGYPGAVGPVAEVAVEDWDKTFAVLVRGVFLGVKHAARVMQAQGTGGSIVNTASVAAFSSGMGPHAYSAAKAAVVNLTRTAATELGAASIRVNCICPGGILTPLFHRGSGPEPLQRNFERAQPIALAAQGEDVAPLVVYLASDESKFVSGAPFLIDGGLTAAGPDKIKPEFRWFGGQTFDPGSSEL